MALKFNCTNCGQELIVKYLKPGDDAKCPYCRASSAVPADAVNTDEKASIDNQVTVDLLHSNKVAQTEEKFPPLTTEESERIIQAFSNRRFRQTLMLVVSLILFFALFISEISGFQSSPNYFMVIFVVFLGYFVFALFNWRCPRCDSLLQTGSSPRYCDLCGTKTSGRSECFCGAKFGGKRNSASNYCSRCGVQLRKLN